MSTLVDIITQYLTHYH